MAADQPQKHFTANIPVPAKLDVSSDIEANWRKFLRQWQNYEIATRLDKEASEYRCAVLLACIGEDAQEIYEGLPFAEGENNKDIGTVLDKFSDFCLGTTHEVYESFKFHSRNQSKDESIDTYVAALRKLTKTCNFKEPDRMIRDRIVIGVTDDDTREKLLQNKTLTLQQAVEICRAQETSKARARLMQSGTYREAIGSEEVVEVNKIKQGQQQSMPPWKRTSTRGSKPCSWCGKGPHRRDACPAKSATCRKCSKTGHYAAVCRSLPYSVRRLEEEAEETTVASLFMPKESSKTHREEAYLDSVNHKMTSDPWKAKVRLEGTESVFKLDTGADVTVVPPSMVPRGKRPLQSSNKKLFGASRVQIPCLGKFTAQLTFQNNTTTQEVYVVNGLSEALLGRPAITALNMIVRVNMVKETEEKQYKAEFPELFRGLGKLQDPYKIRLRDKCCPYAVLAPRRLAHPLREKVKVELDQLEQQGVIRSISKPTDWCAPIVVVPKSNERVRVCVDLTKLNESVRRENYPLPTTDELLAQLSGATMFSKLDCNSGFHQIPLDEESQELTTFITPYGRFCYTRLPFGISSGPEVFQRRMSQLLENHDGVICDIDDLLIYGSSKEEHDIHLKKVMETLRRAGVTLNGDKCQFAKDQIRFLGHVVSKDGIAMDPEKIAAIRDFPRPQNVSDLRRLLGIINQVAKFAGPTLADDSKALRDLLKKDIEWTWDTAQEAAFQKVKKQLTEAPVLAHYNATRKTVVSADASSFGLGAVLLQKQSDGHLKPVFYASRSMTDTERRYAQVEREALAVTWACEKFADYIVGLQDLILQTDHKPLLALLKSKGLEDLPPRIQRFRMRLMRFTYSIEYTRGKNLVTADALSRAPAGKQQPEEKKQEEEDDLFVHQVIQNQPASEWRLEQIRSECMRDRVCQMLYRYVQEGWPDSSPDDPELKVFWSVRSEITVQEGILLYRSRLIIPEILRSDILEKLHTGHQGIVKCRALARDCVWWPRLSVQIESMVQKCPICIKERRVPPEPLITAATPAFPWQKVGMDLFEISRQQYLLVVDYYSRYIEVVTLSNTLASHVISHIKSIFARHGIPQIVMSDNGPQFACRQFQEFTQKYEFSHVTSSPHYPQSNGEAERAVQTMKSLLTKAEDPYLALLAYRSTPLEQGLSPAELLFGRKVRTVVPSAPSQLSHEKGKKWRDFRRKDKIKKQKQKDNFDRAHRARSASVLHPGQPVWVHPAQTPGTIIHSLPNRDYKVQTPHGPQRRNRRSLVPRDPNPEIPKPVPRPLSSLLPAKPHTEVASCPGPWDKAVTSPVVPGVPRAAASSAVTRPDVSGVPRAAASSAVTRPDVSGVPRASASSAVTRPDESGVPRAAATSPGPSHGAPPVSSPTPAAYMTRRGRIVKTPQRLDL